MFKNTIKFNLMLTYSLVILVPFLLLSTYFVITESNKINARSYATLRQNCVSLNESMEREIWQMNLVSLNIAYSNLIKSTYGEYLSNQNDHENLKALNELLANSIGPNRLVDQANLYSHTGIVIASGLNNNNYFYPVEQMPWYEGVENNDGIRLLTYEGEDAYISKYTTDQLGKLFISLSRKYYDNYNNLQGYLEVKKSVRQVLSQVFTYNSVMGEEIVVFDGSGNLIHSGQQSEELSQLVYEKLADSEPSSDFVRIANDKSNYFVTFEKSDDNMLTAIVIDEKSLFMPTHSYIRNVIFTAVVSLFLAFILSYFAANRITVPIQKIYSEMKQVNLNGYLKKKSLKTEIIELNRLYDKFIDMQHKLVDSLNKQLLLKNQEMQSKMLALQSQMNPHFLFNSLANIQSMADANMDQEIIKMCQSMSNILRYISSDGETTVSLKDEITNTIDFLDCMSARFDEDLFYTIDIPDNMSGIKVPKLSIQPLVENSIKFCSKKNPPWHINIKGIICDDTYLITVTDNGTGFDETALSIINDKITEIDSTGLLPSLEINGMGLLNIYLRLKILHGKVFVFKIENIEEGGAKVTIGGDIKE